MSDDRKTEADGKANSVDEASDRRKAIGRILTLAAAAPMAALLFKPGAASASVG